MIPLTFIASLALTLAVSTAESNLQDPIYDDAFARYKLFPMCAAAFEENPQICISNALGNASLFKQVTVRCDIFESSCSGFSAVSHDHHAIVLAFRGSLGNAQIVDEGFQALFNIKRRFVGGGRASKYFYNAFLSVWKGGMRQDLASLRHLHPDYEVWVTGHSLGAAMASLAAGTIVAEGVVPDSQLKLMTFGQPRTGDKEYAHFIDSRISYKFRVVHAQDIIPHMPFKLIWGYKHHRSEIWYNNDMTTNSTFVGCEEADGNACSNSQVALSWPDHMHYFNIHIFDFGKNGCKY